MVTRVQRADEQLAISLENQPRWLPPLLIVASPSTFTIVTSLPHSGLYGM